ncbi:MAG: hypothetical protein IJ444_02060 [Kiritimatiellae bacterium]|nr:hypothetical protein [Kiritimatiellia bacterium]
MAEKTFNSRTVHKHDIEANWNRATFIPNQGEIIVYDIDASHDYERFKIGDGVRNIGALPFANGVSQSYVDTEIATLSGDISAVSELVGDTAVSTQISDAVAATGLHAVTANSSDGLVYTADVPGITSLTAGARFIMIPGCVSASTTPTLDVNGLGAKYIRRRLSNLATAQQPGYTTNWLTAGSAFTLTYDGTAWIVEGLTKPVSADLYGTLSVSKGGTGATTAEAARENLLIVVSSDEPTSPTTGTLWFQISGGES